MHLKEIKASKNTIARRNLFVNRKMEGMSLDEKIGQLLTFTWRGNILTPSGVQQIIRLHAGGLCLEPNVIETCRNLYWGSRQRFDGFQKPEGYFTIANTDFDGHTDGISISPARYTEDLNRLQRIAMGRPSKVPLHMAIDFEGDFKNDYGGDGLEQFPSPMGLAAINDAKLTYEVGLAVARQLFAMGVTQIYSPVCDVNINPKNPEIGIRSFGDNPQTCATHASAFIRGLQDGGLAATAKHFPGRGASGTDAHEVLDVIKADRSRIQTVELHPFKAAIKSGVKAIMTGHSVYPAYDSEYPATLSEKILTGLLREELGFDGVVVSDAIGMRAILEKWPLPKACTMAIKAGVDTILLKADDESRSQCFFGLKQAAEEGYLSEDRINDAVRHILTMKYDQGLFAKVGKMSPEKTDKIIRSPGIANLSEKVAEKALTIIRNDHHSLPLNRKKKIIVIEQRIPFWMLGKNPDSHPHMFSEAVTEAMMNGNPENVENLVLYDTGFQASKKEVAEAINYAKQSDIVLMTNWYYRGQPKNNQQLVDKLKEAGQRDKIVLVTNIPYLEGTTGTARTVICNYSATLRSIKAAANLLFGNIEPSAKTKLPITI